MNRSSSLRRTEWPMPPISGLVRGALVGSLVTVMTCVLSSGARDAGVGRFIGTGGGGGTVARLGTCRDVGAADLGAGGLDGLHDVHVPGAAADVPGDGPADLVLAGIGVAGQQGRADEHHPRGAEAALQTVVLLERRLDRVQAGGRLQALDGLDLVTVGLDGKHGARL